MVVLLHDGVKWLSVAAWLVLLASWFALRLRAREPRCRARVAFVLCASLAAVVAVNLLRMQSAHSCPWYLADFGGQAQLFRLFDGVPPNSGPGKCLPSGHAASAFMWLAVLPVMCGTARRRALFAVLILVDWRGWCRSCVARISRRTSCLPPPRAPLRCWARQSSCARRRDDGGRG